MKPVLHSFDHAYVVNLDVDRERMQRVGSRLDSLGIPFERFPALEASGMPMPFRDTRLKRGAYACAQSHAALLSLIWSRGHEHALILEDDVVFREDTMELMEHIAHDLSLITWDMFYMGLHLVQACGRETPNLGRVRMGFHSHAYAITRTAIPRLLASIDSMLSLPVQPFDAYHDNTLVKLYAIPILAIQEPIWSYTYERFIDRLPQYFGMFDGEDFEQHCFEMKGWGSNWREVVHFRAELTLSRKLYHTRPIEEAVGSYKRALALWPALKEEVLLEPGVAAVAQELEDVTQNCSERLHACCELDSAIGRVLARHV